MSEAAAPSAKGERQRSGDGGPSASADLALVQCPGWGRECPPYSLVCLAAFARRAGFSVRCFDLNNALYHAAPALRRMWEDKDFYTFWEDAGAVARLAEDNAALLDGFVDGILASGARVVGFSVHTTSFLMSLELARRVKRRDPSRVVVFGGPQCSRAQAAGPLAAEPAVDAVCVGEGEVVLVGLLEAVKSDGKAAPAPGLMLRAEGSVRDCGDAPLVADLDSLPLPDYSDFAEDMRARRYNSAGRLDIMDSRGCVRRCHFCSEWQFWREFRSMTGARMFREVSEQVRLYPQVERFYFIGSLLNGAPKELERFCDRVTESGLRIRWEGQAIVAPSLDERLLGKMAAAGCGWLGFGIESGSERLRRAMNKPFSDDDAFRALRAAARLGIRTQVNVMFGLPGETREDFAATLRFLVRCRPHIDSVLASQSFTVLDKHTALYEQPERFGIAGREHHLFWSADGGANDYAERFRRYEEFCALALELGLPETSGVLRVKPDKWFLLGEYHRHRREFSRAARCYGRSMRREPVRDAARQGFAACRAALRPQEGAAA